MGMVTADEVQRRAVQMNGRSPLLVGGVTLTDAAFLTEFGVGWTAVGMVGVQELGNTMVRISVVIVMASD